jgi:mono/diheme cytochrome c family protein
MDRRRSSPPETAAHAPPSPGPDRPGRRSPSPAHVAAAWLLALSVVLATWGNLGPATAEAAPNADLAAQLARGAEAYAFSCTTCHGATGLGFEEARAAFPADHYDCSRCHGPLNPPQMTPRQIADTQTVFSLGHPPALADAAALARFGTAAGLFAYVRATMPRWYPGYLDDEGYLDVTAFVLDLAGLLALDGAALTLDTLDTLRLVAPRQP